ncbi:YciI family protein [Actinotalea sp. K2]|uniref:YciI family protein n=1 Tax=Actinotalea sp. K2 TaxID=2939438 RepID=UPI0020183083|nr:YciI family protein [Actinotalea sp. K2]MCL3861778.1 YciI family protein [Actinotalea sp. K2]
MTAPQTATEYVVLLHDDEKAWLSYGPEERAAAFALHGRFSELCAQRGHTITGGAELAPSTTSRVLRRPDAHGPLAISEGPYAETVEQLGGYYVVRTADLDDLTELVGILIVEPGGAAEIRPVVDHSEEPTP